jgi:hypothetical protein
VSVYVDALFWHDKRNVEGHEWCHMKADSVDELHAFARLIGRNRCWFHRDHYDLTPSFREKAIQQGAISLDRASWVRQFPRNGRSHQGATMTTKATQGIPWRYDFENMPKDGVNDCLVWLACDSVFVVRWESDPWPPCFRRTGGYPVYDDRISAWCPINPPESGDKEKG